MDPNRRIPQQQPSQTIHTEGKTRTEQATEWQTICYPKYCSNKECFKFYKIKTGAQRKGSIRDMQKLPISRKTATLPSQLEESNSGPVGPRKSQGRPNRVYKHTPPTIPPFPTQSSVRERKGIVTGGNHLHDWKGSSGRTTTERNPHGILLNNVFRPQKRWEDETSNQPKEVEPVCTSEPFQDGRHSDSQRTGPAKRLANENRPKRCLFHDTNSQRTPEISQVQGGSSKLPVYLPTVQPVKRSLGLTKTLRPVAAKLREFGIRMVVYLDDILVIANNQQEAVDHTSALIYTLENLGFIIHPEKSMTQPTQRVEFLGMVVDSTSMELQVSSSKIKKIRAEAKSILQSSNMSAREITRLIGKMTAVTQAIPPAPLFYRNLQRNVSQALARSDQDYDAPCHHSLESKQVLQWWIDHLTEWNVSHEMAESRCHDRIRCVSHQLGSNLEWSQHRRSLEYTGEPLAYQLPGDPGCQHSRSNISEKSVQQESVTTAGQHDGSIIHQSPGGTVSPGDTFSEGPVVIVPETEYLIEVTTSPREGECYSGQRVQSNEMEI